MKAAAAVGVMFIFQLPAITVLLKFLSMLLLLSDIHVYDSVSKTTRRRQPRKEGGGEENFGV